MTEYSQNQARYLKRLLYRKRLIATARILLAVAFFILWETAASLGWIDSFFFSSPSRVVSTAFSMAKEGALFLHIGTTLAETLISFGLVVVLGILTAVLLCFFRPSPRYLSPIW